MDGRRSQQCLFSAVYGNQSTILEMPSGMHYESTTADESCVIDCFWKYAIAVRLNILLVHSSFSA